MYRWVLGICLLLSVLSVPAAAEPRLALVVGNSNYGGGLGKLPNPANDAALMASTLSKLGFKVTRIIDADQKQMKRAISDFGSALQAAGPDAAGLFFYAGHGVQVAGENYLIPLHAEIAKEADVELEAVPASWVLKQMEFAGNGLNILILDACRNNPLSRSVRSATRGLARMDAPKGSFIAYSTAPGETAADGAGKNSPYTTALVKAMTTPGVGIEETFRNARVDVLKSTGQQQIPWESSSLTGAFYFQPGAAAKTAAAPVAEAPADEETAPATIAKSLPSDMKAGTVIKDCPSCPELVAIAPGGFTMGAKNGEEGAGDEEYPQVAMTMGPFALGKYEVTKREFAVFIEATGYRPSKSCWGPTSDGKWDFISGHDWQNTGFDQKDDEPVVCVSAIDADAYVKWLSAATNQRYRLPSEAEWEYAARAGAAGRYYWGDDDDDFCANGNIADEAAAGHFNGWKTIGCDDGHVFTAPVGSFKPNAFGLYDMLGNVGEWMADCWNDDLEGVNANGKARRSGNCAARSIRSSGWDGLLTRSRLATRSNGDAPKAYFFDGFRVARSF